MPFSQFCSPQDVLAANQTPGSHKCSAVTSGWESVAGSPAAWVRVPPYDLRQTRPILGPHFPHLQDGWARQTARIHPALTICVLPAMTHMFSWPAEARVPRSEGEGKIAPVSVTGEELNYHHRANHIPHLISTVVNIGRDSMSTPKQKLFRLLCNRQKCKEVPKPFPLMTQRRPFPGLEEDGPVPRSLGESLTRSLGRRRGGLAHLSHSC